jgi:hypothetical protein
MRIQPKQIYKQYWLDIGRSTSEQLEISQQLDRKITPGGTVGQ